MFRVSKTKAQRLRLKDSINFSSASEKTNPNLHSLILHHLAESIVEQLPSSIIITQGPKHRVILANRQTLSQTGPDTTGHELNEVMDNLGTALKLPGNSKESFDKAYTTGTPQSLELLQYQKLDGTVSYWQTYVYPFFSQPHEVTGLIIYSIDTTDLVQLRLQAEKVIWQKQSLLIEVENQRRLFNALIESIQDGLFLVREDERVIYANQKIAELLGIEPQSAIDQNFKLILQQISHNARQPEQVAHELSQATNSRSQTALVEFSYLHPQLNVGRDRELQFSFFDVHDENGHLVGRGTLIRDVTHEKEVERLKSKFISVVSHEMRTPLTGIYGYAELLLHRPAPMQMQKSWINRIYEEARQLNEIVDELLDLSRIEAGRLQLYKSWFNLEKVVQKVLANFEINSFPLETEVEETEKFKIKHRFALTVAPNLSQVFADEEKLAKVLNNLIGNAVKFSPGGGLIKISIQQIEAGPTSWSSQAAPTIHREVLVSITDQGIGISQEESTRIFERFYRTRKGQQLKVRGTGLGLTIVKSLLDLHQGRIWLESQPGHGTTFYFTLPLTS